MISIITYGRNDDRGYGMAKRVAIGLNTLALQVDGGSAEILFVDYNTPDHLPTLPELIWDTLTRQARKRLRVLRVRPAAHARFADRTLSPVIESVARNVALRRANPANGWIFSTNTDALVTPRGEATLLGAVETLPRGQFGLPRYELPERAWEGFVRNDPRGCVELATEWAREARLREIVRGVPDVLFDNPGDFQLVPREDLVAIGGFEEEMLFGWHVDHNLAKRLGMRLGPIHSLEDRFELFHLGHARTIVATHAQDRIENDVSVFVEGIDGPQALHAAESWGLANELIEEIRLDVAPGEIVRSACRALMPPANGKPSVADYRPESFDNFGYEAAHVASYLLDLISTYPPRTIFVYAGVRRDLLTLLREGLSKLGFSRRLLVPRSLAERLDAASHPDLQIGDDAAVLGAAEVLIFAFGAIGDEGGVRDDSPLPLSEADEAAMDQVASLFEEAAAMEERRLAIGAPARLVAAIGMVHTRYEQRLAGRLATSASPFTTRLRYGTFAVAGPAEAGRRAATAKRALAARKWIPVLAGEGEITGAERYLLAADAAAIREFFADPVSRAGFGDQEMRVLARLEETLRPAPALAGKLFEPPAAALSLSGPARGDAWDEPRFAAQAARVSQVRNGWTWERAQMLMGLAALGVRPNTDPVLAVVEHNEHLLEALATRFGNLDVLDIRRLAPAEAAADAQRLAIPRKARAIDLPDLGAQRYQAIVAPHASLFRDGVTGLGDKLLLLRNALKPGGVLAIGGEICLLEKERTMRPTFAMAGAAGFPQICERFFGLRLQGGESWGMRSDDLVRIGTPSENDLGFCLLGLTHGEDVLWPAVWLFTREAEVAEASQEEVSCAFLDLYLGEQRTALLLGSGSHRDGEAIVAGHEPGHVVYGPFLRLGPGDYTATFKLSSASPRPGAPTRRRMVIEAALGDLIVAQETRDHQSRDASAQVVSLDFTVPERAEPCELRVWSDGQSEFYLESVVLSRASAIALELRRAAC